MISEPVQRSQRRYRLSSSERKERPVTAKTICEVSGCNKTGSIVRGYCRAHYRRWQRYGDPQAGISLQGAALEHMYAHMWDECPKWPYIRSPQGYGRVSFGGKLWHAHRLVCTIVHGPPPTPDHHAAHNCGNGAEGCFGAACVAWKTITENARDRIKHGTQSRKLTVDQVREILRGEPERKRNRAAIALAVRHGVHPATIFTIWKRETWAHVEP